jgi:hypothetical protein
MSTIGLFRVTEVKGQTCWWEHYSEIDCEYDLELGFECYNPNGPTFDHNHVMGTVLCFGGVAISGFSGSVGCGIWLQPGGSMHLSGCGYCGDPDATLCDNAGYPGQEAFKYLEGFSVFSPSVSQKSVDWNQVGRYASTFNIQVSQVPKTICCDNLPDDCIVNACGVAEVDWENSKTYLLRAYTPYYDNCPDPTL